MASKENTFAKLSRIFRGGPIIKRRIASPTNPRSTRAGSAMQGKIHRQSQELIDYARFTSYQAVDRWSRYADFVQMESRGEIAAALQVYADEACSLSDKGEMLEIRSDNAQIKALLETLFYDTLQIESFLPAWARQLVKYGDLVLFNDIDPSYGILGVIPIPITDYERVEGFNPDNRDEVRHLIAPNGVSGGSPSTRFPHQMAGGVRGELATSGYTSHGLMGALSNSQSYWPGTNMDTGFNLFDWQIEHFRLLGNDMFYPYGTSILDPARRIWRLLYMTEDLMLMYRAYRASERRAVYIDTRNLDKESEESFMQDVITSFKRQPVMVPDVNGGFDYEFNPMAVTDDIIIPVKGPDTGTRIETLPAGANTAHIEDVQYLHRQLFTSLNVPPAYLGYGEGNDNFMPENLSVYSRRFARTIQRIQYEIRAQLYKMAYIHLTCAGFEGDQLGQFTINLASPSAAAQTQYLESLSKKSDVADQMLGVGGENPMFGRSWVLKNVYGFDRDEVDEINQSRYDDLAETARFEKAAQDLSTEPPEGDDDGGLPTFDSMNFNPEGEMDITLLNEVISLAEEGNDIDEITRSIRHTSDGKPYITLGLDDYKNYGAVDVNPNGNDRSISFRPITPTLSPHSEAGWELTPEEDNIVVGAVGDPNTPIRPSMRASTFMNTSSRSSTKPVSPATSVSGGMRSRRERDGTRSASIDSTDDILDEINDLLGDDE